jgi:hypothetical protein
MQNPVKKYRDSKNSKLNIFNININEPRNKTLELGEVILEMDPNIIFIQETKRLDSIKKSI